MTMGASISVILVLLLGVAVAVPAVAASEGRIEFRYGLGSTVEGDLAGSCDGRALLLGGAPAAVHVSSAQPRLRVYETQITSTRLAPESGAPVLLDRKAEQTVRDVAVPAGGLDISWPDASRAILFERGAFLDAADPFQVTFTAHGARLGPAVGNHPMGSFWVDRGDGPIESLAGVVGWGRDVELDHAAVRATGDATLYLEHATIEGAGFREALPPYKAQTETSGAGVVTTKERLVHALLDVPGVLLETDLAGLRTICADLRMDVDGRFTAYDARGTAWANGEELAFERRELTLLGDFRLDETPQGGDPARGARTDVEAQGAGSFDAIGLDFALVAADTPLAGAGRVAVGLAVAAGLGFGLWKLAAFLFTRLRPDELLEQGGRRRIAEAVQANPGTTIVALQELTGMSSTNVRYHLSVLRRHGRIRAFKLQGSWRYAPMQHDVHALQRRSLLESDPKLQRLVELVGQNPVPAGALVESLRVEWGLSRSGTWNLIDRATHGNLILKERDGKKVVLRTPQ